MSQMGTAAGTLPEKMTRARWIYVGLPLLILFTVSMIDKSNINILLANKPFLQDLGITDGVIKGSLSSIFLVTYAIGQLGWGFVVDRIGAFKSGLIGILFFSGFSRWSWAAWRNRSLPCSGLVRFSVLVKGCCIRSPSL
ncbi:hypothetical protein T458_24035 [Brevibacillus panacihumi W25]|uniref:Major facilitator superfamily (MFS) profile domain-containing protein n=1 Tax=Brevibacillus panacihumi W25 TaxID=1408254 RepID=V6M9X9_9BACL|nr:hypothetical protein [Brevibacillus panacihumi]EST52153.1 hypothetical protein T458_24035 [Brevibacillus panacihumi W25]